MKELRQHVGMLCDAADEEVEVVAERAHLKAPDVHHALLVAAANNLRLPHSVTSVRKQSTNSWNELEIRAWKSTKNR